jgi:hypothetical protein
MKKLLAVLPSLFLSGACSGSFSIPPQPQRAELVQPPPGDRAILAPGGTEVIEPAPQPEPSCFARARHFAGLVAMPCEEIARQARP